MPGKLRTTSIAVIAAFLSAATGCVPKQRNVVEPYTGPTESLAQVIDAINTNNARVPSLWTSGEFEADVVDNGKKHFVNGSVNILYQRPNGLLIVGKKDIAGRVFEIGSNNDVYWLTVRGDVDTMWWGSHAKAAEVDPKEMPINPELLLDVLGVSMLDTNTKQPPVPVIRFDNYAQVYMLMWNVPLRDRWAVQREVWYERKSKLPVKVILYDVNGRVVVRADLSKHKPLIDDAEQRSTAATSQPAGESPPMVATSYNLLFPDTGTRMNFTLNEVASRRGEIPSEETFTFPGEDRAGVSHIRQVDAHAATR